MASSDDRSGERRGPYRQGTSNSQPLSVTLMIPASQPVQGQLIDLTAQGAGVCVPFATDPNLSVGDVVEVVVGSMMRAPIETPAKVVNVGQEGSGLVRYGLEFINVGNLYSQLDTFYARFFNRRRHVRVQPLFDQVIRVELAWAVADLTARVYDISESGMSLTIPKHFDLELASTGPASLRFQLPNSGVPVEGLAHVCFDVRLERRRLAGLEYDLQSSEGFARHVHAIREFVDQRSQQMMQWENSWTADTGA
jgi:c-di-GMP-binding flagellar brake protein YcgR